MSQVQFTDAETAYILKALAKQQYALERYTEMKGPEELVLQELALLQGIVAKLAPNQ
jgi:hypothetical protein